MVTRKMKCTNCGYNFDGHACITDEKANMQDGDISICFNCGEIHQIKDGVLELIDIRNLPQEIQDEILKTNIAIQMVK